MDDDKETCVETVQDVRDRGGGGKGRDGEVAKDGGGDQGEDGSDGRQPAVHILHNMLPIRYQNYFSHITTLLLPFNFTLFQHTQPSTDLAQSLTVTVISYQLLNNCTVIGEDPPTRQVGIRT